MAELLERRHVGQQLRARRAEDGQRTKFTRLDVRQRGRYGLRRDLGIVAEDGADGRPAATGRQVRQLQWPRRLFESARTEDKLGRICLCGVDELLQRLI